MGRKRAFSFKLKEKNTVLLNGKEASFSWWCIVDKEEFALRDRETETLQQLSCYNFGELETSQWNKSLFQKL